MNEDKRLILRDVVKRLESGESWDSANADARIPEHYREQVCQFAASMVKLGMPCKI